MALIFSLEVTVGTLAFVYQDSLKDTLKTEFVAGIRKNYLMPNEEGFTTAWDHIQREVRTALAGLT